MNDFTKNRDFINNMYIHLLKREPSPQELDHWTSMMRAGGTPIDVFNLFSNSTEYRWRNRVAAEYPSGHYHSPVVDPDLVSEYVAKERTEGASGISEINLRGASMTEVWLAAKSYLQRVPFSDAQEPAHRYYFDNGYFPHGDAVSLWLQISMNRPRKIIEIGSGFSSACMLDTIDSLACDTRIRFIEPYPDRLKSLMRADDWERCILDEKPVQDVPLEVFKELGPGDILFIDSTHVLKTGSDVHYELCNILPTLNAGVLIHFHDIHFPFEYPDGWIFKLNKSWNEIYALRLFLMYNNSFDIVFWGSYFASIQSKLIESICPKFLKNTGGSIWLKKN